MTLVIDKSGSMYTSREDVIGGVMKLIDEQKANKDGKCTISLYTFNSEVEENFVGKDVNDVVEFKYDPNGVTAMNDGIGTAIDNTGKWLSEMNEEDRPSKVLVAIFTDGLENASRKYKLSTIKDMIKHQETKYNWTFMYLGSDITTTTAADDLGISSKTYSSKKNLYKNYETISLAAAAYRTCASSCSSLDEANTAFINTLNEESVKNTREYEKEIGRKITND